MIATRTAFVISMGLFLGFLSYGIQTTLVNYNGLVNPEQPLKIISLEKENGEVNFMGEKLHSKFTYSPRCIQEFQAEAVSKTIESKTIESKTMEIKKMAEDIYSLMIDKYYHYRDSFWDHQ